MLIDRKNLRNHLPWIVLAVLGTGGSLAWFLLAGLGAAEWPSGSTLPGMAFGVAGGLIILFEFALWPRKMVRTWRIGRAQTWLRAHIWLGLLTAPLLILHSGLRWGGLLSTVLLILLLVVVASGVFGLVVQNLIPRHMLDHVPAETIHSQIEHVVGVLAQDGEKMVLATCGPAPGAAKGKEDDGPADHLTVGAVRTVGRVQGKVVQSQATRRAPVPDSEPLRHFFDDSVKPYLLAGVGGGSPLAIPSRSESMFRDLRSKLHPAAHSAVEALEGMCNQRRQLDLQRRMHLWLHVWLCVHLPLSVALVALMIWHVYVALKHW